MSEEVAEKAYCCGNSAQREAKIIAQSDLVVGLTFFAIVGIFFISMITDPSDSVTNTIITVPQNTTNYSEFLQLNRGTQIGSMTFLLLIILGNVSLAIILLLGTLRKHHKLLLVYFGATLGLCGIKYASGVVLLIYLHDKVTLGVALIMSFLYNWYCVWIVKILMREITSVSGGESYTNPGDLQLDHENPETAIPLDKF